MWGNHPTEFCTVMATGMADNMLVFQQAPLTKNCQLIGFCPTAAAAGMATGILKGPAEMCSVHAWL